MNITTGSKVQRVAADYTNGRTGTVIETAFFIRNDRMGQPLHYQRARIIWESEKDGSPLSKMIRTWVEVSAKNLIVKEAK